MSKENSVFLKEREQIHKGTTVAPDWVLTSITIVPKAEPVEQTVLFSFPPGETQDVFGFGEVLQPTACTIGRQSILNNIYIYIFGLELQKSPLT